MPQSDEHYFSVDQKASIEIAKINGSRFIGLIYPVNSSVEVKKALADAKEEYPDASHYCFAYRLQGDEIMQHQSDDGEPSGTAGAPILRQLESLDLRNVVLVVVRYFGGTKLGKAGLIKAYGLTAKDLLLDRPLIRKLVRAYVQIQFPYPDTSVVKRVISKYGVEVVDQSFDQQTKLMLAIPRNMKDSFLEALNNSLSGKLNWKEEIDLGDGNLSL